MSRILLCGAFGQDNPGDDALLDAFVAVLADHDLRVTTPARPPEGTIAVRPRALDVARAVADVDLVVVGGGTVFKTLHPRSGRRPHALLLATAGVLGACRLRRIPLALVGVGAGRLDTRAARFLAATIADRADLLAVRDEESAGVLADAGAHGPFRVTADATWSLLRPCVPAPVGGGRGALVVLSHLADDADGRLAARTAVVVDALCDRGREVRLQPWQPGDRGLVEEVSGALAAGSSIDVVPAPTSLADAVATAAGHEVVVSQRFHGAVAAAAAGTPCLSIGHEPKLVGLARRLDQPSIPPHASVEVARASVTSLLSQAPPDPSRVAHEVVAAEQAMRLLRVLAAGGDDDQILDRDRTTLTPGLPW